MEQLKNYYNNYYYYSTSSPADKKYGSTLPTETSDKNIWPKQQLKYNSFDVYHMKCNFLQK